jgi:hypothetical protein
MQQPTLLHQDGADVLLLSGGLCTIMVPLSKPSIGLDWSVLFLSQHLEGI